MTKVLPNMKLLYLCLLLLSMLHAQEVGVPYVDTREAVAQSAVLSPDGETFYTYANNTLTHWSLNPVKVLDSVKIEDSDFSNQRLVNIYTTPDPKQIAFFHYKRTLAVYDLQKKGFIVKQHLPIRYADVIGTNIIAIDDNDTILQLDISNLQIKKQIKLPKKQLNCDECSDSLYGLFKSTDENFFTLVTGVRFVGIDSNSLHIIKEVKSYNKDFSFSLTKKILVGEKRVNIDTLENTLAPISIEDYATFVNNAEWTTNSTVNNLALQNGFDEEKASIFHNTKSGKLLVELYQYKDGSWIIMTPDGYFYGSDKTKDHLLMKDKKGQFIDRINDATYNKYHKPIYLNDSIKDK